MYGRYLKRPLDVVLAASALVVLSPLLGLTALLIWLEDRGTPFFLQQRVGRGGRPFRLVKFRSMPVDTASVPSAGARTLRITRVGKVIRRTNIDELPQLWNILAGDMSVVGPRPALPGQEELIRVRRTNGAMDCVPGLTGLAQVEAYDGMTETEKAEWDGRYAECITFGGDMWLILRTVGYLFRPQPVY